MSNDDQVKIVIDFLENTFTGARMMDDIDMEVRIARAIEAFNLPVNEDVVICTKDDILNKLK